MSCPWLTRAPRVCAEDWCEPTSEGGSGEAAEALGSNSSMLCEPHLHRLFMEEEGHSVEEKRARRDAHRMHRRVLREGLFSRQWEQEHKWMMHHYCTKGTGHPNTEACIQAGNTPPDQAGELDPEAPRPLLWWCVDHNMAEKETSLLCAMTPLQAAISQHIKTQATGDQEGERARRP